MKYGRKERGHYRGESLKQCLINAKDLPMELPEIINIRKQSNTLKQIQI